MFLLSTSNSSSIFWQHCAVKSMDTRQECTNEEGSFNTIDQDIISRLALRNQLKPLFPRTDTHQHELVQNLKSMSLDPKMPDPHIDQMIEAPASSNPSLSASATTNSPQSTLGLEHLSLSTSRPMCKEPDCPIKEPHHEGLYRHNDEDPSTDYSFHSIFGQSNPPAHVWEAMSNICEQRETVEECNWLVGFLRLHAGIKVETMHGKS
ncbi:hypothetical protein ACLMJK_001898 [Lecanora helva]